MKYEITSYWETKIFKYNFTNLGVKLTSPRENFYESSLLNFTSIQIATK